MGYSRAPSKVDGNQATIVKALRAIGCSVQSLAAVGDGCPDLLVGRNGSTWLLEVKNPENRVKSDPRKDLTVEQIRWATEWKGRKVAVVYTVDEAVAAVRVGVA